jgi:hypothetical protein
MTGREPAITGACPTSREPAITGARPTGMNRSHRAVAGLVAAALLLAGCAHTAARPPVSPAAAPSCDSRPAPVRITADDDHRVICVAVGDTVDVFLTSSPERMWGPVTLDGTALTARPNGVGALAIGVTAGFYRAVSAGTARLTSQRLACVDPGPSCGPAAFEVTIAVR